MFRELILVGFLNFLKAVRSSTETFSDGSQLLFQHRYALRYLEKSRYADIGFAMAVDMSVDRLIYVWSIDSWYEIKSKNKICAIGDSDREAITQKVEFYCRKRGLTYARVDRKSDE